MRTGGYKDKIYDSRALAKFFGVGEETIWTWCKTGKLPAFKIGKKWRVRVSDLTKIIDGKVEVKNASRDAKLF